MKNLRFTLLMLVLALSLQSCYIDVFDWDCESANGDIVERELCLDPFDKISLEISATVYVSRGEQQEVRIEAPEKVIEKLRTPVRNNEWDISLRDCIRNHGSTKIYITIPYLEGINLSGSGDIIVEDSFSSNDISLNISGSGSIEGRFEGNIIDSTISGSGDIYLEGDVQFQEIRISGSGNINAFNLQTLESKIVISGSGNAKISAEELLDVRISGSGDVLYKGNPAIDSRISGSGRIIDAN